jgi:hypothetical protein
MPRDRAALDSGFRGNDNERAQQSELQYFDAHRSIKLTINVTSWVMEKVGVGAALVVRQCYLADPPAGAIV